MSQRLRPKRPDDPREKDDQRQNVEPIQVTQPHFHFANW